MKENGGKIDRLERSIKFFLNKSEQAKFTESQISALDYAFDIVSNGKYDFFDFPFFYHDFSNDEHKSKYVSVFESHVLVAKSRAKSPNSVEIREVA